jgi:PAS domain S-box-containing protein
MEMLKGIGDLLGGAVQNAQLYEQVQQELAERKRAEETLRNTEARYRGLFEQSPYGILLVDLETGKTIEANEIAHTQLGYTREEFTALRISDYEAVEKPEETAKRMQKVIRDGSDDFETVQRTKSGEIRNVHVYARTIQLSNRVLFYTIFQDITERKQAEDEIARRNRELSVLYKVSQGSLQSLDLQIMLDHVTPTMIQELGGTAGGIYVLEPDGVTLTLRSYFGHSEEFVNSVRQLKRGEGISGKAVSEGKPIVLRLDAYPTERLTHLVTQSGFQTMVSAPLMAGGEAIGALNLGFREVRTFSPGELRLLETIGQILGTAMQNAQLYTQVQELVSNLERSNAELERFAYVASHDLQEPLRMVTSYLQLLERRYKDKLDGDALEFINYAVDGSNRMKTLISDLLAYSRVGTRGKEFTLIDCEDVLGRVLNTLQVSIEENKAKVTHDPLPKVMADDAQLESLFQNLIGNAIKFHSQKQPRIHVGVKKDEKNWVFSVSDNGIGIDPQFFERIFIIFQRLHNREDYPGTGIGLAISKRIVERHGGRIWIESQPKKGSTFFFTLPILGELQ